MECITESQDSYIRTSCTLTLAKRNIKREQHMGEVFKCKNNRELPLNSPEGLHDLLVPTCSQSDAREGNREEDSEWSWKALQWYKLCPNLPKQIMLFSKESWIMIAQETESRHIKLFHPLLYRGHEPYVLLLRYTTVIAHYFCCKVLRKRLDFFVFVFIQIHARQWNLLPF